MTDLRATIRDQALALLRASPGAAGNAPAVVSPSPAAGAAQYHALACWLCNGHMQPCARADCPKVWRMKDAPKVETEGRSG